MKVEPHVPVDLRQESVLCEARQVVLYDGSASPENALEEPTGEFMKFLKTLDPNKTFILAFMDIEDSQAKGVFYKAQQVAHKIGVHMQGTVAPYEQQLAGWENCKKVRQMERHTHSR